MPTAMLIWPLAIVALAMWFTARIDGQRVAVRHVGAESAKRSLRDRLSRGEINAEEFRRLMVLMHLTD